MDREDFKKVLKERGLKVTNQRLFVLEVLASCPDKHLTAEEIYELVKVKYPEIGLATVYRTIQLLLDLNLVDSINLDDGFVRYEMADMYQDDGKHHHHHLICVSCGKVLSFEDDLLEDLEKKILATESFHVIDHELKFYGNCKECSAKAENQ